MSHSSPRYSLLSAFNLAILLLTLLEHGSSVAASFIAENEVYERDRGDYFCIRFYETRRRTLRARVRFVIDLAIARADCRFCHRF